MTLKQYKTLAKAIASKITYLGGNPQRVRHLKAPVNYFINTRDPKAYNDKPCSYVSGESNVEVKFDMISNPNNPNYKFKTLKPGSMSAYSSETKTNVDITDFNFDSAQFADLIEIIENCQWEIA